MKIKLFLSLFRKPVFILVAGFCSKGSALTVKEASHSLEVILKAANSGDYILIGFKK